MDGTHVCQPKSAASGLAYLIPYPTAHSEFEVQAWLYMALREAGFDVRGEVKTLFAPKDKKARTRAQFCRFDLVIYEDGKATNVLEVKAAPVSHKAGVEATRQGRRYPSFGVPVTFVYGMEGAESVFRRFIEERSPLPSKQE